MFPQTILFTRIGTGKNTHSWPEERQSVALWSDITCEQNAVPPSFSTFQIAHMSIDSQRITLPTAVYFHYCAWSLIWEQERINEEDQFLFHSICHSYRLCAEVHINHELPVKLTVRARRWRTARAHMTWKKTHNTINTWCMLTGWVCKCGKWIVKWL